MRGAPTEATSNAPPGGDRISGVKKHTPITPYFFQILTILRLLGENFFGFFTKIGMTCFFILSPRKLKTRTLVISPASVIRIISRGLKPAAGPSSGGKIDLRQASKYKPRYFNNSAAILKNHNNVGNVNCQQDNTRWRA